MGAVGASWPAAAAPRTRPALPVLIGTLLAGPRKLVMRCAAAWHEYMCMVVAAVGWAAWGGQPVQLLQGLGECIAGRSERHPPRARRKVQFNVGEGRLCQDRGLEGRRAAWGAARRGLWCLLAAKTVGAPLRLGWHRQQAPGALPPYSTS